MDKSDNYFSKKNQSKSSIHSLHSLLNGKSIFTKTKILKQGSRKNGFAELESLIWISIISLLIGEFIYLHNFFLKKHFHLQQEFSYEWKSIK